MMKYKLSLLLAVVSGCNVANAVVTYTGTGGGFFDETRWTDSATGLAPANNTMNPATALNGGTAEDYVINSIFINNIGGGTGSGNDIVLGDASTTLTLDDSDLVMGSTHGIQGAGVLNVNNGTTLNTQ